MAKRFSRSVWTATWWCGEYAEQDVQPTEDRGWEGADFEEVLAALPDDCDVEVVYLADAVSMAHQNHAVLAANTQLPEPSEDYQPQEGPGPGQ